MTHEEAIRSIAGHIHHHRIGECPHHSRLSEALHMAMYALREQPQWISVEERLPKKHQSVIVWTEFGEEGEAEYDGEHFIWAYDEDIAFATHWMPLPEPPKEEV